MHLVVVLSLFGFWFRGHDIGRSITCTAVWGILSVLAWAIMLRRRQYHAMIGFAVAAGVTSALSQIAYSLGIPWTAPLCVLAMSCSTGLTCGALWEARRAR